MNQSANWQLQEALYASLSASTPLITLLGGAKIYDLTPRRTKPPYITIGMTQERDWSTSTEEGSEHIVTLHSWTENRGRKQADELQEAIKSVIANAAFTMPTHQLINLSYEFSEIRRDPDGEILHGLIRYRIITEPTL